MPCKDSTTKSWRRARQPVAAESTKKVTQRVGRQGRPRVAQPADPERTGPATFYRQVIAELRKVVWPTQEQLVTYFIVVMVFVVFMMALIAGLDLAFGKLVFAIFAVRVRAS